MFIINNQQDLEKICQEMAPIAVIGIDTEFERWNTYFAKLSLIQIVSSKHEVIIDVISGLNLAPLKILLANKNVLKIFHAPRQDFEVLYDLFKELPQNIFDTQIAASVCNLGASLSYRDLCLQLCDVKIDKTHQHTNWLKRPLEQKKLEYAIKDALYLERMYIQLQQMIEEQNLQDKYQERLNDLLSLDHYTFNPEKAWERIKFPAISRQFKQRIKVIAAFREECARVVDIPRRHFLTDEEIVQICKLLPSTDAEVNKLKLKSHHIAKVKFKTNLLELCLGLKELG